MDRPPRPGASVALVADDYGLTPGVCEGILDCFERGPLTSTSVLTNAPAFSRYADKLRSSGIEVGLHVAFVGEDPPVLSAREIPTLVDRHGRLPLSWRGLSTRMAARRVDPRDLKAEAEAQLEKLSAAGLAPTHLNTHQHTHLLPPIGRILCAVAQDQRIVAVRVPESARPGPFGQALRRMSASLRGAIADHGIFSPDSFRGLDEAGGWTARALADAIAEPSQAATLEIGLHPGLPADPERTRYRWTYNWAIEHRALVAPSLRDRAGRQPATFSTLADMASRSRGVGWGSC